MTGSTVERVAVVGTGVIGRSWAQVFNRAGCRTRLYDPDPNRIRAALTWIEQELERDRAAGVLTAEEVEARRGRITGHPSLDEAVADADYVQESAPEHIEMKQAVFAELDRCAGTDTILGSSTSALDMSEIAAGLDGAGRCIVAHPVNPPHVVPVVEIVPGTATTPDVVSRTRAIMAEVGQSPVVLAAYVPGFLASRLHIALLREAFNLVHRGVADVDAVDTVIRDGLGLRWALLGPFGVADTNADGGIREYLTRYRAVYGALAEDLGTTSPIGDDFIERLGEQADAMRADASRAELLRWRDRLVREIRRLKTENPSPSSAGTHATGSDST